MNYEQLAIDKRRFINMTLEQEAEVQRLIVLYVKKLSPLGWLN